MAVKDGIVTLSGWVDSYAKSWAAEQAAHRVRGVKPVANDIEIRLPSAAQRTDAEIAQAAVRALELDSTVSVDKLDVTVSKGWVTLKGEVEWQYQKEDAERIIRSLSGVRGVINLITVKPRVSPSDIKEKIEEALMRLAEMDAKRIKIEVQGNNVIPDRYRALLGREIGGRAGSVFGAWGCLGRQSDRDFSVRISSSLLNRLRSHGDPTQRVKLYR